LKGGISLLSFIKNLFDDNAKEIKKLDKIIEEINSLEQSIEALSDDELRGKTEEFKERYANGESLEHIMPEAFAVVREAAKRVLGMRHFDVQLIGGMVLHSGKISEMKTGEGKTLVSTAPAYLNAITGKGVHIVTVNDYLATRDSEWMGQVHRFLGLNVGLIVHGIDNEAKKEAYLADITYGTNNEFGFDYLRDNMVTDKDQMVQRPLHYAIVDEVDSILIDEARTPLIISGQADKPTDLYYTFAKIVPRLKKEEDYTVDEKAHTVALTEEGIHKVEKMIGVSNLYEDAHIELTHHLNQALKAHALMKRDKDYVVKDGEVIIVDEFTGRLMNGRRYSDGLHQAIEAKEGVNIENESQTLATVTLQNYFRMYEKLCGMTGTAATEEEEFRKIYGMDVIIIPPNRPNRRADMPDVIYKTVKSKFKAVVEEIAEKNKNGQPVLVGTISIENSELLSEMLKKKGVSHQVLNAKYHEKEAEIISNAGQKGAVTIATNMAGRGTDIILGEGVGDLGGLHIIGTERHESRRIDNQLRGRAGRQGDPGSSRFYISLEDDLMRLFGAENITNIMERLGFEEDMPIEAALITKSIETAQRRVEGRNFDTRKHVLEYDDVMNKQREVIYEQRLRVLEGDNLKESIEGMIENLIVDALSIYTNEGVYQEEWDLEGLLDYSEQLYLPHHNLTAVDLSGKGRDEVKEFLLEQAVAYYNQREEELGPEAMREIERVVMLRIIDDKWMDHLDGMDQLRQGIGLRAYGQKDPLIEYKFEGYEMFQNMINNIQEDVVRYIFRVNMVEEPVEERHVNVIENRYEDEAKQPVRNDKRIGRNDLCECGSGKKYKKCCGLK
jgi:preprotein translocase subunit SecA